MNRLEKHYVKKFEEQFCVNTVASPVIKLPGASKELEDVFFKRTQQGLVAIISWYVVSEVSQLYYDARQEMWVDIIPDTIECGQLVTDDGYEWGAQDILDDIECFYELIGTTSGEEEQPIINYQESLDDYEDYIEEKQAIELPEIPWSFSN